MSLIQDLREGNICLRNDGTIAQLEMVIRTVFPEDDTNLVPFWKYLYFGMNPKYSKCYGFSDTASYFGNVHAIPVQSFVNEIARERQLVITTDSLEKAIRDIKFRANEIGLDIEIIFKQREKR